MIGGVDMRFGMAFEKSLVIAHVLVFIVFIAFIILLLVMGCESSGMLECLSMQIWSLSAGLNLVLILVLCLELGNTAFQISHIFNSSL